MNIVLSGEEGTKDNQKIHGILIKYEDWIAMITGNIAKLSRSKKALIFGRLIALSFLFLYFSSLFTSNLANAFNAKELFKNAKDSVVLVMSFDSHNQPLSIGSGFFVGDGKTLVTNYHVIEGASGIRIKHPSGSVLKVDSIINYDVEHDLVLSLVPQVTTPLKLSEKTPEPGEDIVAIGNPQGLEVTLSTGIVSGVRKDKNSTYYQITAPISPGSSGGPIINVQGEVLGVSTFYVSEGQNLNFAMPSVYINQLLKSSRPTKLGSLPKRKEKATNRTLEQTVKVIEPFIRGQYPGVVEASIVNKTGLPPLCGPHEELESV